MSKMSDWSIQLEDDFWWKANEIIGGCEHFGEFLRGMEPYRDWVGVRDKTEYAEMLADAWYDFWSDKQ